MTIEQQIKFSKSEIGINDIERSDLTPEEQKFSDIFNSIDSLFLLGSELSVTGAAFMVYSGIAGLDDAGRTEMDKRLFESRDALKESGMGKHEAHTVADLFETQVRKSIVQR